jgi:hypothetical protein
MHCVQLMIYDPLMLAITLFVYFMLLSYSIALLVSMHRFMQFVCGLFRTRDDDDSLRVITGIDH